MKLLKQRRDFQRSKVYAAEKVLEKYAAYALSLNDIRNYIDRILSDTTIQQEFPNILKKKISLKDGRGTRRPYCYTGKDFVVINLPKAARKNWVVLHELSHALTWDGDSSWNPETVRPAHGVEFCNIFSKLVYRKLGTEAHERLVHSFKEHGVRFSI